MACISVTFFVLNEDKSIDVNDVQRQTNDP